MSIQAGIEAANFRSERSARAAKVWLLSFGDLLTLLLSMFIALVAHSGLNPNHSVSTNTQDQREIGLEPPAIKQKALAGTALALKMVRATSNELRFSERDFSLEHKELRRPALKKLRKTLKSRAYLGSRVLIEGCSRIASDRGWIELLQRILEIRRQTIDVGFTQNALALRPLGADCTELKRSSALVRVKAWKF